MSTGLPGGEGKPDPACPGCIRAAASPGTLCPGPAAEYVCSEHTHKTPGPPQGYPACSLLPWVRASQHSPHSNICMVSPLEHLSWADSGCRIALFTQIPLQGPLPQCQPPQLMRLPAFQTGFSMIGRLQALGCPPLHKEVIPEHLLGPQLRRPDGKRARAGRSFGNSFLPSSLQVCPH